MGLKETACESVDRNQVTHDKIQWRSYVNTAMNVRTQKSGNFMTSWATIGFQIMTLLQGVCHLEAMYQLWLFNTEQSQNMTVNCGSNSIPRAVTWNKVENII